MLLPLIHTAQTLLSLLPAFHTVNAISQTLTYESRTVKAAKYSNTADHHLWMTRKTLAAGAVGVVASLVGSVSLLLTSWTTTKSTRTATPAVVSVAMAAYLVFAWRYIAGYWRGSAKVPVPGMGDYNRAISSTAGMRKGIAFLAGSWVLGGGVYFWGYLF